MIVVVLSVLCAAMFLRLISRATVIKKMRVRIGSLEECLGYQQETIDAMQKRIELKDEQCATLNADFERLQRIAKKQMHAADELLEAWRGEHGALDQLEYGAEPELDSSTKH